MTLRIASSAPQSNTRVASTLGSGRHLSDTSASDAQRAERAGHQPRDVEARDVLHHPPAEREVVAAAVDDAHAEDEVAHRARIGAPRSGEPRRDRAAQRRAGAEVRRLEAEHLADVAHRAARPPPAAFRRAR